MKRKKRLEIGILSLSISDSQTGLWVTAGLFWASVADIAFWMLWMELQ